MLKTTNSLLTSSKLAMKTSRNQHRGLSSGSNSLLISAQASKKGPLLMKSYEQLPVKRKQTVSARSLSSDSGIALPIPHSTPIKQPGVDRFL
jgi:hypothetical protein